MGRARLAALGLLVLALAACSNVQSGRVQDLQYYPGYFQQVQNGSIQVGQVSVPTFSTEWVDECYSVTLTDHEDTGYVCVAPEVYNQLRRGDFFDSTVPHS